MLIVGEVLMCCDNTPRTMPFGTCPLNLNTRTNRGLCTNTASGNTLSRYCFMSSTRVCERSHLDSQCSPSPSVAQADWINHSLCPKFVQVQLRDDLFRRHRIKRVPLPGLKPSLPCHALLLSRSASSTTSRVPDLVLASHAASCETRILVPCRLWIVVASPSCFSSHNTAVPQLRRVQPSISSSRSRQPRTPIFARVLSRTIRCPCTSSFRSSGHPFIASASAKQPNIAASSCNPRSIICQHSSRTRSRPRHAASAPAAATASAAAAALLLPFCNCCLPDSLCCLPRCTFFTELSLR